MVNVNDEEEAADVDGFSSIVTIRELSSLRQFRRRRRNGVLNTVVVLDE